VASATSGMPRLRHLADAAGTLATRVGAVGLDVRGWTAIGLLAMLNWLVDCACLVTCVWAISGTVPWRGVLVAYGLAQVAASLPLVPGGLGVVEGSLSFFLVAYGMSAESALAGVFLYRIVSFWSVVPVGWGIWGCLTLREQRSQAVAPVQRPKPVTVMAAAAKGWHLWRSAHGSAAETVSCSPRSSWFCIIVLLPPPRLRPPEDNSSTLKSSATTADAACIRKRLDGSVHPKSSRKGLRERKAFRASRDRVVQP